MSDEMIPSCPYTASQDNRHRPGRRRAEGGKGEEEETSRISGCVAPPLQLPRLQSASLHSTLPLHTYLTYHMVDCADLLITCDNQRPSTGPSIRPPWREPGTDLAQLWTCFDIQSLRPSIYCTSPTHSPHLVLTSLTTIFHSLVVLVCPR